MATADPARRLRDIIDNIDRIRGYVTGVDFVGFAANPLVRDAVERCFSRISEAAVKLGTHMEERYSQIPWDDVRGLGNVLRHDYDDVDEELVWEMIEQDLTPLRTVCETELQRLTQQP